MGGVEAFPGVVPQFGTEQGVFPPTTASVPGGVQGSDAATQGTTPQPFVAGGVSGAVTAGYATGSTPPAYYANGTAINSTGVPPQTTTGKSFWDWWNKLWGSKDNKGNGNDDYYDDDYYDDDYYDNYYNDYNNTNNGTSDLLDWLEGESTTTALPMGSTGQTGQQLASTVTPSPCPLSAVSLGDACANSEKVPGVDELKLTLKDVMEVVFDEAVINDLILECGPGQWCLKDARFFNPLKTDSFTFFCNYTDCLADYSAQCNTEERTLVTSSLRALCRMSEMNVTDTCSLQTKMLLHVAKADLRRAQLRPNSEEVCGMQEENSETCGNNKPSCLAVADSFACLADRCLTDDLRAVYANIPSWQWYFWDPSYMRDVCKVSNATGDCGFVLPTPETHRYVFLMHMDTSDTQMMTWVAVGLVVALAAFVVAVYACVKRFSGGYTRDKVQYAEIRDANFDHV